jgi:hypothetical protein
VPAQNDAADFIAAVAPRHGDDSLTILASIEPFDRPDIRFDTRIL